MSGWLTLHVRRIIAIVLLVLDLGLEPGSALSFVGISEPDDGEPIADLCRQDDFWWGRKCAAIELARSFAIEAADSSAEVKRGTAKQFASAELSEGHPAVLLADIEVFGCTVATCEFGPTELGLPRFQDRTVLRNSYIGRKRYIVLII